MPPPPGLLLLLLAPVPPPHPTPAPRPCSMLITYSKQQPGETWVSGIMAAQGSNPVSFESAALAQDFTEYLSSANGSWYLCRQVAGGSLKVRAGRGRGRARWGGTLREGAGQAGGGKPCGRLQPARAACSALLAGGTCGCCHHGMPLAVLSGAEGQKLC